MEFRFSIELYSASRGREEEISNILKAKRHDIRFLRSFIEEESLILCQSKLEIKYKGNVGQKTYSKRFPQLIGLMKDW